MTEYGYRSKAFQPGKGETVSIPDNAIGVTVSTFGDPETDGHVHARYLVPGGSA